MEAGFWGAMKNIIHINRSALICATEVALECLYNTYTIVVDALIQSESQAKVILELQYAGVDTFWDFTVKENCTAQEFKIFVQKQLDGMENAIYELHKNSSI